MSVFSRFAKSASSFGRAKIPHLKYVRNRGTNGITGERSLLLSEQGIISSVIASLSLIGLSIYVYNKNMRISCDVNTVGDDSYFDNKNEVSFHEAISKSRDLIQRIKDKVGAPGIVVGVSVDGKNVWEEGIGYADIENRVPCTENTVMRIASISKSITMAAVAKLWEDGKLDLDKPVQEYVPDFPVKSFDGQQVTLTCRHLISHLGGIRHYNKNVLNSEKEKNGKNEKNGAKHTANSNSEEKKDKPSEFEMKEYFIKDRYNDVKSSLQLFKDDPLVSKPGSKYLYSTHGWTLVSAIVEEASKEKFPLHMYKLFEKLGMHSTHLDTDVLLIYHRSRNYLKNKQGHIINAPYVDNSYKWAGGGFLSTVGDLLKFGNAMLYSLQYHPIHLVSSANKSLEKSQNPDVKNNSKKEQEVIPLIEECDKNKAKEKYSTKKSNVKVEEHCERTLPGFLKYETVKSLWTPVVNIKDDSYYGMGWVVVPEKQQCEFCEVKRFCVNHSGGAIGTSSVLYILPKKCKLSKSVNCNWACPPKGIIVTIFANLQDVRLEPTASKIADIFSDHS